MTFLIFLQNIEVHEECVHEKLFAITYLKVT